MKFKELGLIEPILKSLDSAGYVSPTAIQEKAIPHILKKKDLLGCAQTGTGKTAAFALPIIQGLINSKNRKEKAGKIKVLVLSPTRELAIQIDDNFKKYGANNQLQSTVVVGGVNQKSQIKAIKKGIDILVATPGRLLDLINQKYVRLGDVEVVVLDEADTMLDMGFIKDVKKILAFAPTNRQTLLFSATMPYSIKKLAETFLKNHVTVTVTPEKPTVDKINQSLYYIDKPNKLKLLTDILKEEKTKSSLVFTRTKHGANNLGKKLGIKGINCEVIHGNKSQNARVMALNNFKNGTSKVMIATDIAARGIDINELSHVINYEIPNQPETYVHRIGRTGRAGLEGTAISLCDISEKEYIKDIQKIIKQNIPEVQEHAYPMQDFIIKEKPKKMPRNAKKSSLKNDSSKSKKSYSGSNKRKPNGRSNRKR